MSYHQLGSNISLPINVHLLKQMLSEDQILAIYKIVGQDELKRIAAANHDQKPENERADLDILFRAITAVTDKSRPWIIGFASQFAESILTCVEP